MDAADSATGDTKDKIGKGLECIAAVRDAIGSDMILNVDLHSRFNLRGTAELFQEMQHMNVHWVEAPIQETVHTLSDCRALRRKANDLGIRIAGAEAMARVAEKTGRTLIEAFYYRHHPAFAQFLEILHGGSIGALRSIKATFIAPVPFREGEIRPTLNLGGGSLMDMGCYPIHWVRKIANDQPTVVKAQCDCSLPGVDKTTNATLSFPTGLRAELMCSMDDRLPLTAKIEVRGEGGSVLFSNPMSPHKGFELTVTGKPVTSVARQQVRNRHMITNSTTF